MGNFYVNFTVKTVDQEAVVKTLKRNSCKAYVTPPAEGCVVVFEEKSDTQDPVAIEQLGTILSRESAAPVLGVLNHDDDVLCYWLFEKGRLSDSYNSDPDYFGGGEHEAAGGDVAILCAALAAPPTANERVEPILRGDHYAFALERHADLVQALGLPEWSIGSGYRYLSRGEVPEGLTEGRLVQID